MDAIKELLTKWATPFVSKFVTRALLYGVSAVCLKLGLDATEHSGWVSGFADFAGAAGAAGAAMLIDLLHHRHDKQG